MKPSRDVGRLVEIMAALRHPETGCPWDVEQNFRTIAPYTLEEAYEVIDAIERDDMEDLREELGDLLLQVVYHARMAEEADAFTLEDVTEDITKKMIRRHPHVFGDEQARSSGMAKGAWERIKAEEKLEKAARRAKSGKSMPDGTTSLLDGVPVSMTGLLQAIKLQQKASKVGFDWNDPHAVIAKIREELDEVEAELEEGDSERLCDEIGDVLFAVANLARHLKIDPDQALRGTNQKFRKRFSVVESHVTASGLDWTNHSLDELEEYWKLAKNK